MRDDLTSLKWSFPRARECLGFLKQEGLTSIYNVVYLDLDFHGG
jgi:hypothetical protein